MFDFREILRVLRHKSSLAHVQKERVRAQAKQYIINKNWQLKTVYKGAFIMGVTDFEKYR